MAVEVGTVIPSLTLKYLSEEGMKEITTDALFKGRKVVMFALPGAYTPTCSARHLPGYVENVEAFKAKGVDAVICLAVNDPFVMRAWGKEHGADGKVFLLPDGNAVLTRALGMEFDASAAGLGIRSRRYAVVVNDGTVSAVSAEEVPSTLELSSAEAMLAKL